MTAIEKQPLEQRQAYAIDELSSIVEKAESIDSAQEQCNRRLMEMIEQHILPNNQDEVQPVIEVISGKIRKKFEYINQDEAHFEQGQKYMKDDMNEEAVATFKNAIAINPRIAEYYDQLGRAYQRLKKRDDATVAHKQAIHLDPNNAQYHFGLAVNLCRSGKPAEGVSYFESARDLGNLMAGRMLPYYYLEAGQPKKAREECERMLELEPSNVDYWHILGESYFKLGEIDKSIEAFLKEEDLSNGNTSK